MIISNANQIANNSHCKFLLQSNTTNGSTVFTDISRGGNTHTITGYGSIAHSTTQKKFGSTAVYFNGSDQYLTVPDSEDFNFGSNDFMIQFWMYLTGSIAGFPTVMGQENYPTSDNISFWIQLYSNGEFTVIVSPDGTYTNRVQLTSDTGKILQNQWQHIAAVKRGSILAAYIDGVNVASDTITSVYNSTETLKINLFNGGSGFQGYIAELSIHKGFAPKNITVPNRMI